MHRISVMVVALAVSLISVALASAQESPADVLARIPEYDVGNLPAVRLLEDVSFDIQSGGVVVMREHKIIWVRTTDGISSATPVKFPYKSTLDEIHVLFARTILPTGENIDATAITSTRPQQRSDVLTDNWNLTIGFPRVGAGCVVEYAIEAVCQPRFPLFSAGLALSDVVWVVAQRVAFTDHTGIGLRYELRNAEDDESVTVTQVDPGSIVVEGSDERPWATCPCVSYTTRPFLIVSQYPSWDALADDVRDYLSGRSEDMTGIAAKADELLVGVIGEEETIRVLFEFVRDEIRYLATTFRLGGWQAKPAAETLLRRQGDCKAKSALLIALLAEAGIEAYPALVSTECDLADGVGDVAWNIDCIDHVVTAVRLADGGLRILDPTCWWCTPSRGMMVSNTTVWVLSDTSSDGFRGDLVAVPARTPRGWMTDTEYRVDLAIDGATVVAGQFTAGAAAGQVTERYIAGPPAMTDENAAWIVYGEMPSPRIQTHSATFLSREEPVILQFEVRGSLFGAWTDEELAVSALPPVALYGSGTLLELARIVSSEAIDCTEPVMPQDVTWATTLELPEGVEVVSLPADQVVCTSVASYFATYAVDRCQVTVARELIIDCDGVDPLEYEELKEVIDAAVADSATTVLLRKEP